MKTASVPSQWLRRIRSFARRDSRITPAQQAAWERLGSTLLLDSAAGELDYSKCFGREAPCFLEVGFGSGCSLAVLAQQRREADFIGIETFKPGIGSLLQRIEEEQLANIRIYYGDAVDVLEKCIPDHSLQGIHIFFPDPWPKRRHHKRRLIQAAFVSQAAQKLKKSGCLQLATDWQDYAKEMMRVLSAETSLKNLAGPGQFAERSSFRPLTTKFESRGEKEGRLIWELQFAKI